MLSGNYKESLGRDLTVKLFLKNALIIGIITFLTFSIFAENSEEQHYKKITFYGAVSSSNDSATISMTEDLYFSHVKSLPQILLEDKRSIKYEQGKGTEDISFYPEIEEKNGLWVCTLVAINNKNGKTVTNTREYDSYYRILMDAKSTIIKVFEDKDLDIYNTDNFSSDEELPPIGNLAPLPTETISLEKLSGTWKGENYIDKIIILRGGRGFVIFKNGASMNISITISDDTIIAKQTSKTNASYFPDIPRNIALTAATTAEPIEWHLKVIDNNTLNGDKYTLKANSSDPESATSTEGVILPVTWHRQ